MEKFSIVRISEKSIIALDTNLKPLVLLSSDYPKKCFNIHINQIGEVCGYGVSGDGA